MYQRICEDNMVLYLYTDLCLQDKMDGFVPAHFLGWYIKVGLGALADWF